MDDSQSPPDTDSGRRSGNADAERRTALRLRDAEVVAATRRDMFGDGSLLDALAGHRAPREGQEADLPPGTAVSAEGAEPQPPDPEALADEPPPTETPVALDPADAAQPLDAIIDSFPADQASQSEDQAPVEPKAEDERGSEEDAFASNLAPPSGPEHFQVSAIFDGLSSSPTQAEDGVAGEEQEAETFQPEGHPEDNDAPGEPSQDANVPGQPAAAAPGFGVPVFYQPPVTAPEPSNWPPSAAPAVENAPWSDQGGAPAEPSSDPHQDAAASMEPAREISIEPFPGPLAWPPYLEPPGYQANTDAPPLEPPSLVNRPEPAGGASPSPFPGPPAWPPFPEPPGSEAGPSEPEPGGLPPYIELPAHPEGDDEHSASSGSPAFRESQPPFTDGPAAEEMRPEMPRFPDFETSTTALDAAPRADATSRIAAEANATAQALDNLQRLLDRTVSPAAPQPQPAYSQAQPHHQHSASFHLPQDERMPFAREMASMLPLPLPPPPSEHTGSKNVYLLGFLTGLVLSVMAGAALYFLINTG